MILMHLFLVKIAFWELCLFPIVYEMGKAFFIGANIHWISTSLSEGEMKLEELSVYLNNK